MRKLKILLALSLILIFILVFRNVIFPSENSFKNSKVDSPISKLFDKKEETITNGKNLVNYQGNTYFIYTSDNNENGFQNMICKINKSGDIVKINNANQKKLNDIIVIQGDKIIYSAIEQAYYSDLNSLNKVHNFINGKLFFVKDGKMVYSNKNVIYYSNYNTDSFKVDTQTVLISGKCDYLGENDKDLFFYSLSTDNSFVITAINKENMKSRLINKIEDFKYSLSGFEITNNSIFLVFSGENINIKKINISSSEVVEETINVGNIQTFVYDNDLCYYSNDGIFKFNNGSSSKIEFVNKMPNVYDVRNKDGKIVLYKNNEYFKILDDNDYDISKVKISKLESEIFIEFYENENDDNKNYKIFRLLEEDESLLEIKL